MIEAKKGQVIIIKNPKIKNLEGIITAVSADRLRVYYTKDFQPEMEKLQEGDSILADVHTAFGVKSMKSTIMSMSRSHNEFTVENSEVIQIAQKREFVRSCVNFRFFVKTEGKLIASTSIDISAGGIKFLPDENIFAIGDVVEIKLLSEEFGKNLTIEAQIINNIGKNLVAKYTKISEYDRDKIAGFCVKTLSK